MLTTTTIIIIAAFIGAAALAGGVAFMFRGGEGSAIENRLDVLTGATNPVLEAAKKKEKSLLTQPLDDVPGLAEALFSRFGNLRVLLDQADVSVSPSKFLIISAAVAGSGAAICLFAGFPKALVPLVAGVLATVPLAWALLKRKRRLAAFARQLPDALELIARALRAGHSLAAGFNLVSEEMADPIQKEFNRVYEAQNLGVPLDESLEEMTERVPNLDLRFFATAVILQRQMGGDLSEILDKIGTLIRERFKIWGQIQSLTGEGRLSGIVLLALPPVLFLVMYRLNPGYVMVLFTDPLGKQMLAVALVLQVLGALVIRKIVNIKV